MGVGKYAIVNQQKDLGAFGIDQMQKWGPKSRST